MGSGDKTFSLKIKGGRVFHKDEDITEYVINLIAIFTPNKAVTRNRYLFIKEVIFHQICTHDWEERYSEEEIIQSLSTQQLPKEFILGEGITVEEQIKNGYYE